MATLVPRKPLKTAESRLTIDAGLGVGAHRFQLVVQTADGRRSVADTVVVTIAERTLAPDRLREPARPEPARPVAPASPVRPVPDAPSRPSTPIRRPRPGDRDPTE